MLGRQITGVYIGSIKHLKGQSALLQESADGSTVLAQFNDLNLTLSGSKILKKEILEYEPHARFPTIREVDYTEPPKDALAFGWHVFQRLDFKIDM